MSELRAYVELPAFPDGRDDAWMRLLSWLDANTDMGPVLDGPAGEREGATVILATDAETDAGAVRSVVDVTTRALEAVGRGAVPGG